MPVYIIRRSGYPGGVAVCAGGEIMLVVLLLVMMIEVCVALALALALSLRTWSALARIWEMSAMVLPEVSDRVWRMRSEEW